MKEGELKKMTERVAKTRISAEEEQTDEALENTEQAIDTMLASIQSIEENLPDIQTSNPPEKASVDSIQELLDTAIKPYFSDILKAIETFK